MNPDLATTSPSAGYDFIAHLTRFCRVLREHGLLVGPQETADAVPGP